MSAKASYRPDIDGLRAVAVTAVVLYHLGASWLPGGFIGVDIFFVISGFLITRIITQDLDAGRFSVADFFTRRVRRLLPALIATVAISFVFAFLFFTPADMASFSRSALSALLGVSNFTFWLESGYFDVAAHSKPLLHTWSLSVEWQFYALWTALLLAVARLKSRSAYAVAIILAALLSFALNLMFQDGSVTGLPGRISRLIADGPATIFYNSPFRVFEFSLGAIVALAPITKRHLPLTEAAIAAGAVLIAVSFMAFGSQTVFPSYNALPPTLGAALIIYFGQQSALARLALANGITAGLGRISYSVYLVHWPLLVFFEYYNFRPAAPNELVVLFIASIVLGFLLFKMVEQPFRLRGSSRSWRVLVPVAAAVLLISGASLYASNDGLSWRISRDALGLQAEMQDSAIDKSILGRRGCEKSCEFGNLNGSKTVLLVGDSHLDHYTKTFEALVGTSTHFLQVYAPSCFIGATMLSVPNPSLAPECAAAREQLKAWFPTSHPDAIIIGERWPGYRSILTRNGVPFEQKDLTVLFPEMLDDIGRLYAGFKGPIVLVGHSPTTNTDCYRRPEYVPMVCPDLPRWEHDQWREAAKAFAAKSPLDVHVVEPITYVCPTSVRCLITDPEGHVLYTDGHHLSVYGARMVAPDILRAAGVF